VRLVPDRLSLGVLEGVGMTGRRPSRAWDCLARGWGQFRAFIVWLPAPAGPALKSVEKVVTACIYSSSLQASPPVGPLAGRATNERETVVEVLHLGQRTMVADQ
jgi:hypothetical protein